ENLAYTGPESAGWRSVTPWQVFDLHRSVLAWVLLEVVIGSIGAFGHGGLRRTRHSGLRPAGSVICSAEHIGQRRQRADGRLQDDQYELPGPAGWRSAGSAVSRRGAGFVGPHQYGPGLDPDRVPGHLHGDRRRWIFRRGAAVGHR